MNRLIRLGLLIGVFFIASPGLASERAVDMEVVQGESGVYILWDDGVIQTAGKAVDLGYPKGVKTVDMVMTASGKGYYVLDEEGFVYTFGDAVNRGRPFSSNHKYVDMESINGGEGFYFLREDGHIERVGNAVNYGEIQYEDAIDMEMAKENQGYYVLYKSGQIAFFGNAVDLGYYEDLQRSAVDMEVVSGGYYVMYDDGLVRRFGKVDLIPTDLSSTFNATELVLTQRGYRILNQKGEIQNLLRVNNQGNISWFAQAKPRQFEPTPTPTHTNTPTPTLTPTRTPRASVPYFNFNISGFTAKRIGKLPEGVRIPAGVTSSQASLAGGGTYVLVSDGDEEKVRAIHFFSAERFDEDEDGERFVELTPERGAAEIRGISFSQQGMIVTVKDDPGTFLFLIEGDYESATVQDFMLH